MKLEGTKQEASVGSFGLFALLGTLFVLASSSPAAAGSGPLEIHNEGKVDLEVSYVGCGYEPATIAAPYLKRTDIPVPQDCSSWTVTIVDPAGRCTVQSKLPPREEWENTNVQTIGLGGRIFVQATENCVPDPIEFEIDKDMDDSDDDPEGQLTTWTFTFAPSDDRCTDANVYELTGDDLPPPAAAESDEARFPVIVGYVEDNAIVGCEYTVVETQVVGWTLTDLDPDNSPGQCWDLDIPTLTAIADTLCMTDNFIGCDSAADDGEDVSAGSCHEPRADINFENKLDPIPLTVTKTFTGRDYYTTVDRADFHLYTPGLCGAVPFDPFGGLLGSIGVFRTINASQLPQIVLAKPYVRGARFVGPEIGGERLAGACTYRVQENNAPEGCVALNPDGSNADGPYWEQTWIPGETVAFNFNIVNDCAETPEPTPTPDVAPTTTPKKPGAPGAKKPSGGGTAAPKFTG